MRLICTFLINLSTGQSISFLKTYFYYSSCSDQIITTFFQTDSEKAFSPVSIFTVRPSPCMLYSTGPALTPLKTLKNLLKKLKIKVRWSAYGFNSVEILQSSSEYFKLKEIKKFLSKPLIYNLQFTHIYNTGSS